MERKYNVGLGILRSIMCFMVVLNHCWDAQDATGIMKIFAETRVFAVPVFMLMSFMLVRKSLVEHKRSNIIARFERLIYPHVIWGVIYWIIYKLLDIIVGTTDGVKVTDLLWQIMTGHSPHLNSTMWYQADLIYITVLFLIVFILFKKWSDLVLLILSFIALVMQYSGVYLAFSNLRYELSYPLGRFFEVLPVAVMGVLIARNSVLEKLKADRIPILVMSISVVVLDYAYGLFNSPQGFGYSGIRMVIMSLAFVVLFYLMPFEKISDRALKVTEFLTGYTLGIYCMHQLVSTLIVRVFGKVSPGTNVRKFSVSIVIYVICFILSMLGSKILKNTKLKMLFK